ncbi:PaaI family thioesterase [Variovorax paradoxus]|uniref:PaaI family thioesterase n=1 Tax=Variovorax paradoxus TaxID=34073 RepID=UPI003F514023
MPDEPIPPVLLPSADSLRNDGWKPRTLPGFAGLIGPLWTRKEGSGWAYGILATHNHTNPAGVVHGGLLMSLIDHAMSTVAWEHLGRVPCVTVQLDTRFMSSAQEHQFVKASAVVERATSSLVFTRGAISIDGRDIAAASAILKVLNISSDDRDKANEYQHAAPPSRSAPDMYGHLQKLQTPR